ncbi:MAG: polymorphic toxin-type HINT domain-containing protein, partial [Chloroflexota bacterium]
LVIGQRVNVHPPQNFDDFDDALRQLRDAGFSPGAIGMLPPENADGEHWTDMNGTERIAHLAAYYPAMQAEMFETTVPQIQTSYRTPGETFNDNLRNALGTEESERNPIQQGVVDFMEFVAGNAHKSWFPWAAGATVFAVGMLGFLGVKALAAVPIWVETSIDIADCSANVAAGNVGESILACGAIAIPLADDFVQWARYSDDISSLRLADNATVPCLNSFSADTLVSTVNGFVPISQVRIGDTVYAYDEFTGIVGVHTVVNTFIHDDDQIVYLTIDGEEIETTPPHPFYTDAGWQDAGDLQPGDLILSLDGDYGVVERIVIVDDTQTMYDLDVETVDTFAVGTGAWVVHNNDCIPLEQLNQLRSQYDIELRFDKVFDDHAHEWFGVAKNSLRKTDSQLNEWRALIERGMRSNEAIYWSSGPHETIAHLTYLDGKPFLVQFYAPGHPDAGQLATAFIPNADQLAAIERKLGY